MAKKNFDDAIKLNKIQERPDAFHDKYDDASEFASNNASMQEISLEEKEIVLKKTYSARIPEKLIEQLDDAIHTLKKKYKISRDTMATEAYTDLISKYHKNGLIA